MENNKIIFFQNSHGYTLKDFKKWGQSGGRPPKYANDKERYKTYRRRKALAKLAKGEITGILNMTTGRINKLKVHQRYLKKAK